MYGSTPTSTAMKYAIILITVVLLYIIEALHDYNVILNQNVNEVYDRKWHIYDFIFHILNAALISFLAYNWLIFPIIGLIRWTVFQNGLNYLRGKSFFYLGQNGIDGILRKSLGLYAGQILFGFSVITLTVLILLLYNVF